MKVLTPTVFLITATALLTFFGVAAVMAPPITADTRDHLVEAGLLAGAVFAFLAARRLIQIQRALCAGA